ncbi:hypothetical protein ACSSS7_007569 [Eimeria intestinalis]
MQSCIRPPTQRAPGFRVLQAVGGKQVQHLLSLLNKQQNFVKQHLQGDPTRAAAAAASPDGHHTSSSDSSSSSSSNSNSSRVKACPFGEEAEGDWLKQQLETDEDWVSLLRRGEVPAALTHHQHLHYHHHQQQQMLLQQQLMCTQFFFAANPPPPAAPDAAASAAAAAAAAATAAEDEGSRKLSQEVAALSGEH